MNAVSPISGKAAKEITEAMAVVKRLRPIALASPMNLHLIDLCSGNGLAGVLAAHMLPFASVTCVDKKKRERHWEKVQRFKYIEADIMVFESWMNILGETRLNKGMIVLSAVHACGELARRIIDEYRFFFLGCRSLVLMPCCVGSGQLDIAKLFPQQEQSRIGRYQLWTASLAQSLQEDHGTVNVYQDRHCTSPCNNIIVAERHV